MTCPAPGQLMLEITRGTGQRCKEFVGLSLAVVHGGL